MNILKRISNSVDACFDYVAKARTVAELSQLSDRQLMDIGFSREELNAKVTELWVNNEADTIEPAKVDVVQKPVTAPKFDFGLKLASMYSSHNRTGTVV